MKPPRFLLTAVLVLAAFAPNLRAEVVPILSDTSGAKSADNGTVTLTNAGGSAKTLAISAKKTAYIRFATADTGILPSEVTAARITIFFAGVTKPGNVSFHNITSAFTESFSEKSKAGPAFGAAFTSVAAVKGQYLTIDVTAEVLTWLTSPTPTGFGVAITSDSNANVLIASKEGAASGHPATLEIDLVADSIGGVTAAQVAMAANRANSASSTSTAGTIVLRDANGNFAAGTVTATAFSGDGSGLTGITSSGLANGAVGNPQLGLCKISGFVTCNNTDPTHTFVYVRGTNSLAYVGDLAANVYPYQITLLEPGTYTLVARASSGVEDTKQVTVTAGQTLTGVSLSPVNLLADTNNCGACGNVCVVANGTAGCTAGNCTVAQCNAGFANCDNNAANGCEKNLNADVNNCGTCGHTCSSIPNGTPGCAAGACGVASCNAGFTQCSGSCKNLQTDANNCGSCSTVCQAGHACANGICQ